MTMKKKRQIYFYTLKKNKGSSRKTKSVGVCMYICNYNFTLVILLYIRCTLGEKGIYFTTLAITTTKLDRWI